MPRASRLEAELKKQFAAEVVLIPGSDGIYEIMADDRLVFSKHAARRFAEPEEIISLIQSHR
ncbi:MAG: Rdx family protein [Proteobacteria bacterium]|nr:Rdx family protein [Pseudomonadota bacterium]MDP2004032.1 Rdx family protein [Desulfurivibrionaceae bacterium]MBU4230414.1 Rdx family protein [Pseudomonadota bacterium]MBU4407353.1 Rdx family protein [Pseudomonadota bacterium]MBU4411742.1 Rdx family protein [Pseudomonadota bacterium]